MTIHLDLNKKISCKIDFNHCFCNILGDLSFSTVLEKNPIFTTKIFWLCCIPASPIGRHWYIRLWYIFPFSSYLVSWRYWDMIKDFSNIFLCYVMQSRHHYQIECMDDRVSDAWALKPCRKMILYWIKIFSGDLFISYIQISLNWKILFSYL